MKTSAFSVLFNDRNVGFLVYIVLIAFSTTIAYSWTGFHFLLFADGYVPLNPSLDLYFNSFKWNYVLGFGEQWSGVGIFWYALTVPYYLLSLMGFTISQSFFLEILLLLLVSNVGMYLLLNSILFTLGYNKSYKFRILNIIPSTLYSANFYVAGYLLNDSFTVWISYSLVPMLTFLLIAIYSEYFGPKLLYRFLIFSPFFLTFLLFGSSYPIIFVEGLFLIIITTFFVMYKKHLQISGVVQAIKSLFLVLFIFSMSFWIVIHLSAGFSNEVNLASLYSSLSLRKDVLTAFSDLFPFSRSITFPTFPSYNNGSWQLGNLSYLLSSVLSRAISYAVTIAVLVPLIFDKYRRNVYYLFCLAMLFLLDMLLAGSTGPLRSLLMSKAFLESVFFSPYLNAPVTLGFLASFCFAVSIFFALVSVQEVRYPKSRVYKSKGQGYVLKIKFQYKRSSKKLGVLLTLVLTILLVGSQIESVLPSSIPFQQGVSSRTEIPEYYQNLIDYLSIDSKYNLVLGLPVGAHDIGLNFTKNSGYIGPSLLSWSGIPNMVDGNLAPADLKIFFNVIYNITSRSNTTNFSAILDLYNIKYVVLETNFIHTWPGGPPPFDIIHLENFLNSQTGLHRVETFGPEWVYENQHQVSIVRTGIPVDSGSALMNTSQMYEFVLNSKNPQSIFITNYSFISNVDYALPKNVGWAFLNPDTYEVTITNSTGPFLLTLEQNFADGWVLFSDGRQLNFKHLLVNGFANGWIVNKIGSFSLLIKFEPYTQFYDNPHYVIIIASLLIATESISFLFFVGRKRHC